MKKGKPLSFMFSQKITLPWALLAIIISCFANPAEASAKPLQIGVASMVTPVSAVRYYQKIVDYLANKLEIEVEMVHRTTYDEIDRMLEQRQVDVAFICSAPYVNDKKSFGIEKNLSPFQPACAVGGPSSGLITAEDLLRHKGLVGKMAPTTGVKSDQEEDIWGMQQDFGC